MEALHHAIFCSLLLFAPYQAQIPSSAHSILLESYFHIYNSKGQNYISLRFNNYV